MNIGILIHSDTGNTLSVAQRIQEQLEKDGHTAKIEKVTAIKGDPKNGLHSTLSSIPKIEGYDKIIVGAPINGFALSRAMKEYLALHGEFQNKDVNCFVTQHFKRSFLGGNQGIKYMLGTIRARGGKIKSTAVVHWSSLKRDAEIKEAIEAMADI
ncbi:MAG: hypothetical protein AB1Z23_12235 [Eubacteriales bacterium]